MSSGPSQGPGDVTLAPPRGHEHSYGGGGGEHECWPLPGARGCEHWPQGGMSTPMRHECWPLPRGVSVGLARGHEQWLHSCGIIEHLFLYMQSLFQIPVFRQLILSYQPAAFPEGVKVNS